MRVNRKCGKISESMRKNYKVLITGAAGFVGRTLVPQAVKYFDKNDILCLIRPKNDGQENIGREIIRSTGVVVHKADLVSKKGLKGLPKAPQLIIHMAASTDTATVDHRCNDLGTENFLKALGPLGPKTHLIYTSTLVVYGGRRDCSKPLDESSPPAPSIEYARSKLRAEKILKEACKKHKFRLTILRFNTVYGASPKPNTLFKILRQMVEQQTLLSRLNWPGLSGVIFVDDLARAILLLSSKKPQPGEPELYFLNPESLTFSQMSKLMHKALGIRYRPIRLPKTFWQLCKIGRNFIPSTERFVPPKLYSWLWRASLIVDDVVYTKTNKVYKIIPEWKPRKLKDVIEQIVS